MARARVLSTLVIAAIAAVMVAPAASAAPLSVDIDGITYSIDGAEATVTAYDGATYGTAPTILASVNISGTEYAVTAVGPGAFFEQGLLSVDIPTSVTSIGNFAFALNLLSSIDLPESITSIGNYAFLSNALLDLTIPSGVSTIAEGTFAGNLLTSLTIPSTVTSIDAYGFAGNLVTSITIPSSVTFLGHGAFVDSANLTDVLFLGPAPTMGYAPFGDIGSPDGPLVSYYERNTSGQFTTPTAFLGEFEYNSQALATVTFDANGHGMAPAATDLVLGDALADPGSITAPGYTFNGWFVDPTGGTAVTFPRGIETDLTLYAQWTALPAPVTFDANGHGTAPAATDVVVGGTVANPGALTATGYTFNGWFTAATGGTAFDFTAPITAATTLYAQWSAIPVLPVMATVAFNANGHGTAPAATDVVVGGTVANPGALTATGYTFNGWFTAATGGTAIAFPTTITAATTLYAQWTAVAAATEPTATAPTAAATAPALASTGAEGTLPLSALALLLVGAGTALYVRQRRSA